MLPRPLQSFQRRYLTLRDVPVPETVLLWWGSYGFGGGPTIGDRFAVENLSRRLTDLGHDHAILTHPELGLTSHMPIPDLFRVSGPIRRLAFVCGPLTDYRGLRDFLAIHKDARRVAVGVSVLGNHQRMTNRFDAVVARDGTDDSTFDLAITETVAPARGSLKVAGISLRGRQLEYGRGRAALWSDCESVVDQFIARTGLERHLIETRLLPHHDTTAALSGFSASDIVVTTRLHGALFALAHGKPVIAIDQIPGGAKLTSVLSTIGWPHTFSAQEVTSDKLFAAYEDIAQGKSDIHLVRAQERMLAAAGVALERSMAALLH